MFEKGDAAIVGGDEAHPRHSRNPQRASARVVTRPFAMLMIAQASFGYAFSSFFLLPKFLVTQLEAGPVEVGIAMATYGATALVFIPAMGAMVDRFGRRRFLTAGAVTMAAASGGFVLVSGVGALLYTLRALQGVAFAMAFVGGVTLAVDQSPAERLAQAIALIGLAMLSMNAVAPATTELIADRAGWSWSFATAAAAALLCGILSRFVRDDRVTDPNEHIPSLWQVVSQPTQLRIAAVVVLTGAAFGAMITFHQPFALGLGMTHVRSFFVTYAAAAIVVRVGFGSFIDRVGWHRVAIFALLMYVCVVTSMAGLSARTLALFGAGFGIAHGFFYPALNALAVAGRGDGERGKVMALFQAAFSAGFAGGTFPLGFIAERAGYPAVFFTAGGCAFAALVLLTVSPEGRGWRGQGAAAAAGRGAGTERSAASRARTGGWE